MAAEPTLQASTRMSPGPEPSEVAARAVDLRAALEQMRRQAEREITRLNRKLADREHAAESRMVSATESIALQQELTTLQRTLGQKEQALDQITLECRRLEDQLEDQHLVFDDLKQEVERKESSLKAAREEVLQLQRQLALIQEQSLDLSGPASTSPSGVGGAPTASAPVAQASAAASSTSIRSFTMGILSALIIVGAAGLVLSGGGRLPSAQDGTQGAVTPATRPESLTRVEPSTAGAASPPVGEGLAGSGEGSVPHASAPVEPPPVLRDSLRGGAPAPALALLPAGELRMGQNTLAGGDTGPEREVKVAAFGIGLQEVTFDQYDRFARATGRRLPDDYGWGRGDRPVVGVSWSDAQAYVEWLSAQSGRHYRLPSEAEWEYAARGGGRGSYWWGFGLEPGRAACFDCGSPWDNKSTAPVGSFPPSAYGLYDTAGNVMEWVADCYHPTYEGAPSDGRARLDGDCRLRIARGGAFNKPSASMRAYARTKLDPDTRLNNLGFRVALDP